MGAVVRSRTFLFVEGSSFSAFAMAAMSHLSTLEKVVGCQKVFTNLLSIWGAVSVFNPLSRCWAL